MADPFYIYRSLRYNVENGHRWMTGLTWVTTDPEVTDNDFLAAAPVANGAMDQPFGTRGPNYLYLSRAAAERVYPRPKVFSPGLYLADNLAYAAINPNAPEAAFRLERVGAGASSNTWGRMAFPIPDDSYFQDLPSRRHIDAAWLQGGIASGSLMSLLSFTTNARTYYQCNFHRDTKTFTWASGYKILPNPIRIWQRWRSYSLYPARLSDRNFTPDTIVHDFH